ncbi:MAG TPA: HAD family phosphatase [Candidatus Dormibacteraeota bacterium]|nr:HAD family phosphatase [Candidatus Dormibacteraeota bacterium]
MKKLPKAILFDADGTLYDSEHLNFALNQHIARHFYAFDFTWELYDTHVRRGSKRSHEVLQAHGINADYETYQSRKLKIFQSVTVNQLAPMPGLLPFLNWCKNQSVKCVVVSAAGRGYVVPSLKALGIKDFFEILVTHEDIGLSVKPHPRPYRLGLKRAGVSADQAIAIEDTDKGVSSAQAAGIFCAAIRNDANSSTELAKANLVIKNYKELKSYLSR